MAKLTIVVGMAGSGKTHYVDQTAKEKKIARFSDFTLVRSDNISERAGHRKLPELVATVLAGKDCIADEPHLMVRPFRDEFCRFLREHVAGPEIEWIYFTNDAPACATNVIRDWHEKGRKEEERVQALLKQIDIYSIPDGVKIVDCYRSDVRFRDANAAKAALHDLVGK